MTQDQSTQLASMYLGQADPKAGYAKSYSIQVNGVLVDIKSGSLKIKDNIDHRTTCSFTIIDLPGTEHYKKGMPIQITDLSDGSTVFGGTINSPKETMISESQGGLYHKVTGISYQAYAGRRIAAESYVDTYAGDIVTDLMTKYLANEGITAGTIEQGPLIKALVVNYSYVSDAYDKLVNLADFIWYIDSDKKLHFHARTTVNAPFDADRTVAKSGTVDVTHSNDKYRNRQYVRGGLNITDPQTATFTGDGSSTSWTLPFPVAKVPTITVGGTTQTVGIRGVDTGKDFYWSKGDHTVSQDGGAAPVAKGTQIGVNYQGLYDIVVLSTNESAIDDFKNIEGGGTGYWDDIEDDPNTENSNDAFQHANALLKKYVNTGRTLKYRTKSPGLKSGMLQTVNFPEHDLNNLQMLIQEVSISDQGPILWYDVTAVEGPALDTWSKWMAKGLSRPTVWVDKVNIGEEQTLIVLVQQSTTWKWTESTNVNVFSCPIPSTSLYPSSTLYPC